MFSIIEHIEYLMMSHDCVIIPGWGALIAQYSDASFNHEDGTIGKPQRKLGFNSAINHNDGLLAQSIVRREGITYDEAVRFIAMSVTTFKQQLADGNEVSLGRLGFFSSNDGLVDFIPFYHEISNDEFFGLRSINFKTLAQLQQEQEISREPDDNTSVVQHVSWGRRAMQMAASIIVLLALVPVLTTPILRSDSFASLSLPEVKKPQQHTPRWDSVKVDLAVALPQQAFLTDKAAHRVTTKTTDNDSKATITDTDGTGRYFLIISSLKSKKTALKYVQSHHDINGHELNVLKRGNIYRIYIARDNDPATLLKIKKSLPERYNNAWVCD